MIRLPYIFRSGRLLLCTVLLTTVMSCHKEGKLTASDDNKLFHMPQGNQPVDQQIMQFLNKYNSYILYKFETKDFNYTPTGAFDATAVAVPAGSANVQVAYNFLQDNLFSNYTEDFLQRILPLKILLADRLTHVLPAYVSVYTNETRDTLNAAGREGRDQITFGWANKIAGGLTPAETDTARGQLNASLLIRATRSGLLRIPAGFKEATDYAIDVANPKMSGIFRARQDCDVYFDLREYFAKIMSTDYATLNSTLFTPQNDPAGKFKKKYNLVVNYYRDSLGIDLQAIGNK